MHDHTHQKKRVRKRNRAPKHEKTTKHQVQNHSKKKAEKTEPLYHP